METIEILKKVFEQEIAAEKRYAAQISSIRKAYVIRKVLNDIRKEEINHADLVIKKIKVLDETFDRSFTPSIIDNNFLGKDNIKEIRKFLEIDAESEKIAYTNYMNFSEQAQNLELKKMLIKFIEDEKQHEQKVLNLIDNLKRLE